MSTDREEPITPEQIISEAQRVIYAAPEHGPFNPKAYADALPPSASHLASLLRSREMTDLIGRYHDADKAAMSAQKWNILLTKAGALAGIGAGVLGGVYLVLGVSITPFALGLGTIPLVLLVVALVSISSSVLLKPLRAWKGKRLEAEQLRLEIFDKIVRAPKKTGSPLALTISLACFTRHLFQDQKGYFKRRSKDKRNEARRWKGLGWFAAGLTALGSSVPQAVTFVAVLGDRQGLLYDALRWLAAALTIDKTIFSLSWFIGFNLAALAALIPMIYKSSELAKTYAREFRFLNRSKGLLADAREAAATGQWASMYVFPQVVLAMLLEGVEEWAAGDEMPADPADPADVHAWLL